MKTRAPATKRGDRKIVDRKRVLPPVSTEHGGVKPGIDLDHTSELQELDDLGLARRLYRSRPKSR